MATVIKQSGILGFNVSAHKLLHIGNIFPFWTPFWFDGICLFIYLYDHAIFVLLNMIFFKAFFFRFFDFWLSFEELLGCLISAYCSISVPLKWRRLIVSHVMVTLFVCFFFYFLFKDIINPYNCFLKNANFSIKTSN